MGLGFWGCLGFGRRAEGGTYEGCTIATLYLGHNRE